MRKTREEKAITLIALIITIVVLLILAVVAINAITGDGIIQHAVNAKTSYENAQAKEQDMIAYYETYLQTEGKEGKWVQEGSTLKTTNSDGTITKVKIGDYVKYNAGSHMHTPDNSKGAGTSQPTVNEETTKYNFPVDQSPLTTENLNWRVLGINGKGELELISENPTTQTLFFVNDEGYINAEENLNNFCNDLYGKGVNEAGKRVATGARSLNVDDINKLSGYNPTSDASYGNKWIYKYPTTAEVNASTTGLTNNIWYKTIKADGTLVNDWGNTTNSAYTIFRLPGETTAISSTNPGSKEVTHTSYSYSIPYDGLIITENAGPQWLASRVVFCKPWGANFGIRYINDGSVYNNFLFRSSDNYDDCFSYKVRPIVSLSTEVSLTEDNSDNGNEKNVWKIL